MDIHHILVVIDASRAKQQPALERATQLLEHYGQASLSLMICDYIPALDGGHLVFYMYEAVAGRPPNEKALRILMSIGIAAILTLMLFALGNDLFC